MDEYEHFKSLNSLTKHLLCWVVRGETMISALHRVFLWCLLDLDYVMFGS